MKEWTLFTRFEGVIGKTPFLVLLLLLGCYPDQPQFVEEYDVAYTNYSPGFDFSIAYTYSSPDRVLLVDDSRRPEDPPEFIDDIFGDVILENIRQNLAAKGWTEVDESADPELIILPTAFDQTFLFFYSPGFWCWYFPGCFPGWGWWHPGFFPGAVTGFTTGTVLVQITDPSGIEDNQVPVVWTGTLNGLLQGSDANIIRRIERNLDQAFTHPPFD